MVRNLHVLGRELGFWGDFISVLKCISARNLKNTGFQSKTLSGDQKRRFFRKMRYLTKIRRPLLVRGTRLRDSRLVCCNRSVVCGLFGLTGLWSMVCSICGLFFNRSRPRKKPKSPSTFPGLEILGDPGNLQFFDPVFYFIVQPFWGAIWTCILLKNLKNKGSRAAWREFTKMVRKKCDLGVL